MVETTRSLAAAGVSTPAMRSRDRNHFIGGLSERVRAVRANGDFGLEVESARAGRARPPDVLRVQAQPRKLARGEGQRAGHTITTGHAGPVGQAGQIETAAEPPATRELEH